jgi:putative DNA primase/helicase
VLEKAYNAKNRANFKRHYEGDYSLWEGKGAKHKSHSEADFELVLLLLYWTNNDTSQVDRLFRQSGLMREKWDRKIKDNETYGQRLIADALRKGRT